MTFKRNKINFFLKNITWRVAFIKETLKKKRGISLGFLFRTLLPKKIRILLWGNYPVLSLYSKKNRNISLEIDGSNILFTFFNFKFFLPKEGISEGDFFDIFFKKKDFSVKGSEYVLSDDPYETKDVFLKENDFVIDAGANIGIFSVYASSVVGEKGRVFAFEPISHALKFLRKNIEINNIKNVEIIESALGRDVQNECVFKIEPNNSFESSSGVIFDDAWEEEVVSQTTIDEIFLNKGIRIDYIKADIEGSERHMLEGAKNTIRKFKPKIAVRIYHLPDDPVVIEKLLKDFCPEYKIEKTKKTLYAWI